MAHDVSSRTWIVCVVVFGIGGCRCRYSASGGRNAQVPKGLLALHDAVAGAVRADAKDCRYAWLLHSSPGSEGAVSAESRHRLQSILSPLGGTPQPFGASFKPSDPQASKNPCCSRPLALDE